jgi:hypothetical protein
VTTDDILAAIGVLEEAAVRHGFDVQPGAAVAAAQRALVEVRARVAVPA